MAVNHDQHLPGLHPIADPHQHMGNPALRNRPDRLERAGIEHQTSRHRHARLPGHQPRRVIGEAANGDGLRRQRGGIGNGYDRPGSRLGPIGRTAAGGNEPTAKEHANGASTTHA